MNPDASHPLSRFVAKPIKVSIIAAQLEEFVVPPVPLAQHSFDQILVSIQPRTNRPFFGLPPGIVFDS